MTDWTSIDAATQAADAPAPRCAPRGTQTMAVAPTTASSGTQTHQPYDAAETFGTLAESWKEETTKLLEVDDFSADDFFAYSESASGSAIANMAQLYRTAALATYQGNLYERMDELRAIYDEATKKLDSWLEERLRTGHDVRGCTAAEYRAMMAEDELLREEKQLLDQGENKAKRRKRPKKPKGPVTMAAPIGGDAR